MPRRRRASHPKRKPAAPRGSNGQHPAAAGRRPSYDQLRELVQELESSREEIQLQNQQLIESQDLLEQSASRYAELYDFSPVAYVTLDHNGVLVEMNLTAATMLGRARDRLLNTPFIVHVERRDRRHFLNHVYRCRASAMPCNTELTLNTPGGRVPVELSTAPPIRRGERNLLLRTAIIDLTDYRRAEEEHASRLAVLQGAELLNATLTALPIGVRVIDATGVVTLHNQAAARIWGDVVATPVELWDGFTAVHDDPATHTPDEARPVAVEQMPIMCAARDRLPVLNQIMHVRFADGVRKTLQESAVPLSGEDGSLAGVVAVCQDVTDRRRTELELRHAKEAAELANRLKDEFLATVSHELRTPLSAILLWTHLLRTAPPGDAERLPALDVIYESAQSQKVLIEDLLDVSRITSGKIRVTLRDRPIAPVVRAAIASVRPTADAKGVTIATDFGHDPDALVARIDAGRIQQVAWNLLSNAIKFTPAGGRIDVSLHRPTDPDGNANAHHGAHAVARLVVTDNGRGITPDFLPHVFDRFRQAEPALTREHGGLGLGLHITHHLVQMHNGTIRVHSEGEGRGTTFTVDLPALRTAPETKQPTKRVKANKR